MAATMASELAPSSIQSVQCFGRKKNAVAATYCNRGRGPLKVNGSPIELVKLEIMRYKAFEPVLLGRHRFAGVDMRIAVLGGGHTSHCHHNLLFPNNTLIPNRNLATRSSPSVFPAMTTKASAKIIDGKFIAKQIREEVAGEVAQMKNEFGIVPGLTVILVGSRKDSQTYVRNKKKACEAVGIMSYEVNLPEDSTEEEVLKHISSFNSDPSVHGILVQLPLPPHMNEEKILNAVSIEKDVDGFHPLNIGRLAMQGRDPLFVPCTPKGCMELLHRYGVEIKGKRAVVIGRSNIVGMPAALLLQRANATISIVHSRTSNPEDITRQADIVISAVGVANLVRGSWLKPGAVVIDVGINPVDDPEDPRGYRLVGDVCYEEAREVASAITPVPGGVGPMTIAMLLSNTLISAKRIHNVK